MGKAELYHLCIEESGYWQHHLKRFCEQVNSIFSALHYTNSRFSIAESCMLRLFIKGGSL